MTARLLTLAALAALALGLPLSRSLEPAIAVDTLTLPGGTPALRLTPLTSGPHPIALAAHGVGASKETLFRFCEALAVAGFDCIAIDLPGHGESPLLFGHDNARTITDIAHALGPRPVTVFLGHSMGAYAGAEAVRRGGLDAQLFIAVGALPDLGRRGPPLLLLAGRFEEAVPPPWLRDLRDRTNARLVLSPWSDHALEPYDPVLVDAAVEAASAAASAPAGEPPPPRPALRRWRRRLAGLVIGLLGALVLADRLSRLVPLVPRLARARGLLLSAIVILAFASLGGTWLGAAPVLRRVPLQLASMALFGLLMLGATKLRAPRWILAAFAGVIALTCVLTGAYFTALLASLFALVLLAGTILAWIAERGGTRRDGDLALAVFVGYAIGQWIPRVF